MKLRTVGMGLLAVLLVQAVCFAGHCLYCLKQIPDDQSYCDKHKGMIAAQEEMNKQEKDYVDAVGKARENYEKVLKDLRQIYQGRGDATKLQMVNHELADLGQVRKFLYLQPEDILPRGVQASREIGEAEDLYRKAKALSDQLMPPWDRPERLKDARDLYMKLVQTYPQSTRAPAAAFELAKIMESVHFQEYARAATFYELCFQWNPKTQLPARFNAALIYETKLNDYDKAAKLYYIAGLDEFDPSVRQEAKINLERLQKRGRISEKTQQELGSSPPATESKGKPAGTAPATPTAPETKPTTP